MYEWVTDAAAEKTRLDVWLAMVLDVSRSAAQKLCKAGAVTVEGAPAKANTVLRAGMFVTAEYTPKLEVLPEPQNIPLDVRYEDEDVVVINKARGMVVHPSPGHADGTLVNALLFYTKGHLAEMSDPIRPGIVHRLDRDTSGLLVAAKTPRGRDSLQAQIRAHSAGRIYYALVHGNPSNERGIIKLALGRDARDRLRQAVLPDGRDATTHFTVVERMPHYALLRLALETGRTHQIRVHLSYIGYPIVQDPLYGRKRDRFPIEGQALHAAELSFDRPADGERITVTAPWPDDFAACLTKAREEA